MEIGRFLYYNGVIPYQTIISGIVWQRSLRPSLGQIARNWGWLTDESVQKVLRSRKHTGYFGDKAVHHGYITKHQLKLLLVHQKSIQNRIGEYFVREGFLTREDMELMIMALKTHNADVMFKEKK
jgi:hypothetical protein